MDDEVKRFFKSIQFSFTEDEFEAATIKKVKISEKEKLFKVYLELPGLIALNRLESLLAAQANGIMGQKCIIEIEYQTIDETILLQYLSILFERLIEDKPSLVGLRDYPVHLEGSKIIIPVNSKIEKVVLDEAQKDLKAKLECYGLHSYTFKVEVKPHPTPIPEEVPFLATETVPSSKPIAKKTHRSYKLFKLNDLTEEQKKVAVEAYVFAMEEFEKKGSKATAYILNLKISDKTNSILAKVVKFRESEFKDFIQDFKVGAWYHLDGSVIFDNFLHDLIFEIESYHQIDSQVVAVQDEEPEKRVELHLHTMMSAMDGVIPYEENNPNNIVNFAIKLGHQAVAITDHNGCQAFPEIYRTVTNYNRGKKETAKFKVLYGAEINIVNDDIDLIYNEGQEYNLLKDEFVVLDTETTGFYAGQDQMIEIGAVKIQNGVIIDRFSELIKPDIPLPEKIIELTSITPEMLVGKASEAEVTKRFLAWMKDLPVVAHNAKFDISFITSALKKYNLAKFNNLVLDTMSISRYLHPDWPNHKLATLVKRLGVEWDESSHHRADYDAEGTAQCFIKLSRELDNQNIETTKDLKDQIDEGQMLRFEKPFHATLIAKNKKGLANLYKIISLANTEYLFKNSIPKVPRRIVSDLRQGLLIGSGCVNGEIFTKARTKDDEELVNLMNFYDYIEIQPPEAMTHLIGSDEPFKTKTELEQYLIRLINIAKQAGKLVCATGDAHTLNRDDKIYREIIINQKFNGKLHPLRRYEVPDMYFRTTRDMLDQFRFLDDQTCHEIVVTNPNQIATACDWIEVIPDTKGIPFSPRIPHSQEITITSVYDKAHRWYGDPLPAEIEKRIALELYGDSLLQAIKRRRFRNPLLKLHEIILGGSEVARDFVVEDITKHKADYDENTYEKMLKKPLGGIIGGGFDVIYLIAQKLVQKSNEDGFLVGSRGSVGSSFVATMMSITEVNPLPAHYRCPKCLTSIFNDEEGKALSLEYSSGFDLPDKKCPNCQAKMIKDGQNIPFATFLGFNADKVPDIDLNFSDLNQAQAHAYTKVLFGEDKVFRAGTIGTIAEKIAYGYVKGYCETKNIVLRNLEIDRLARGCIGVKRTTGQHPGGIIVIPDYKEIFDFTPYQYPAEQPDSNWKTTHFDYHAIAECVLKLDILGHSDPTQFRLIQDITKDDVTQVPLDDKETMGIFLSPKPLKVTKEQIMCETGTLGIPEFGTQFTIQLVKDTKPKTFAELIKISGLSHGTDVWLGNAKELIDQKKVPFKEIIGCRDDIMLYLIHSGLEPILAFEIMEFVRKGKATKEPKTWQKYVKAMQEVQVADWFIDSCAKIKYLFPKAHAAAYVISAFRIAWYKVHRPIVYYASYFSAHFTDFDIDVMIKGYDAIKQKICAIQAKGKTATNKENNLLETMKLALEMTARGFKFGPIDLKQSEAVNFVISADQKTLIPPFRAVDGLGDAVSNKIITERNKKPFYSVEDFQTRGEVNVTTLAKLRAMGVLDDLPESSQLSLF